MTTMTTMAAMSYHSVMLLSVLSVLSVLSLLCDDLSPDCLLRFSGKDEVWRWDGGGRGILGRELLADDDQWPYLRPWMVVLHADRRMHRKWVYGRHGLGGAFHLPGTDRRLWHGVRGGQAVYVRRWMRPGQLRQLEVLRDVLRRTRLRRNRAE